MYIAGIITYYSTKRAMIKRNKKHKKFDIKYFRDDLKKMSPSYISYILDFKIELEKDVAAHVLKLYLDKYIKYENNKFIVTSKNQDDLHESDKYLLDFVKNDFNDVTFLDRYQNQIKLELQEQGYITYFISKRDRNPLVKFIVFLLCILFVMGIFFFPAIIVAKIIAYVKYGLGKRTKKGEELLEQIYGLKNFLKDFSIIKERKLEELYLQEHYLVYALTLGVNNKVDNEILDKIKKHINHK